MPTMVKTGLTCVWPVRVIHVAISRERSLIRFRNGLKADSESAHWHLSRWAITGLCSPGFCSPGSGAGDGTEDDSRARTDQICSYGKGQFRAVRMTLQRILKIDGHQLVQHETTPTPGIKAPLPLAACARAHQLNPKGERANLYLGCRHVR